ncbi:phage major capsid protein [Micromonospora matsumotoense]|uniref:phage major capsid protein n=1 Tax=Micromonospora matsumotoense TaxID=121616 RepID=UPI003405D415
MAERDRERANAEVLHIIDKAKSEARSNFTSDEDRQVKELEAKRDQAKKDIEGIKFKLETARSAAADQDANEKAYSERTSTGASRPAYDQVARVGAEARTYRQDTDRKGSQFVRDVAKSFLFRDMEADHRLSRHMQEERVERGQYLERAAGTGAFSGLVVPQYLTDMYAPAVKALRPFADICNKHDLPANGMTVNISRITTGSSVALQSSENSSVSETNMDDTLLTENVQTAAGQQTLSRQAIERGTGVEEIVMSDLFRSYATTLDNTLLNQATTGLSAVAQAVTYTSSTPTGEEMYPKLLGANANLEAALLGQATPSHVIMHSRRWNWLQTQMSDKHPLFGQPGIAALNAGTNLATGYGNGVRGILPNGNLVIVDNNIATNLGVGTNQDEIYVVAVDECHLWEDPNAPVFIRAEQAAAASLGVLLVMYGYFAYSFRRYTNGVAKIGGTGLVTPTF